MEFHRRRRDAVRICTDESLLGVDREEMVAGVVQSRLNGLVTGGGVCAAEVGAVGVAVGGKAVERGDGSSLFRTDVSVGLGAGAGGSLWYPPRLVTVVRARWSAGGDGGWVVWTCK
jgi:hypothetical protein